MHDQADELRRLVLRAAARHGAEHVAAPLWVVSGGSPGAGATTLAVNLALAVARQGQRVVLIDADATRPDATRLCDVPQSDALDDVLAGRRTVHEVLQRGPAGLLVAPGAGGAAEASSRAAQRLLDQLRELGPHADLVLLDAGSDSGPLAQACWRKATEVLLVASDDPRGIMDAYAIIKALGGGAGDAPPHVRAVVNQAADATEAAACRLRDACRRFLDLDIELVPSIPRDELLAAAARSGRPLLASASAAPAATSIEALAMRIAEQLHGTGPPRKRATGA